MEGNSNRRASRESALTLRAEFSENVQMFDLGASHKHRGWIRTSSFRIHFGPKPLGPDTSGFLDLVIAQLGCCWPTGLAPAAIGATGAAGQH